MSVASSILLSLNLSYDDVLVFFLVFFYQFNLEVEQNVSLPFRDCHLKKGLVVLERRKTQNKRLDLYPKYA